MLQYLVLPGYCWFLRDGAINRYQFKLVSAIYGITLFNCTYILLFPRNYLPILAPTFSFSKKADGNSFSVFHRRPLSTMNRGPSSQLHEGEGP